jgi:osmotically inducible protein OsmC
MATRDGSATWTGDLKGGSGTISVASGLFSDGQFSFGTRFEDGPGTNPEELIGAAHAACFSMALSNALAQEGHTPESVATTAHVHLRFVDGAPTITKIELETEGRVPGIDQAQFEDFAGQAKAGCVVSRALGGVEEITLQATLAS